MVSRNNASLINIDCSNSPSKCWLILLSWKCCDMLSHADLFSPSDPPCAFSCLSVGGPLRPSLPPRGLLATTALHSSMVETEHNFFASPL